MANEPGHLVAVFVLEFRLFACTAAFCSVAVCGAQETGTSFANRLAAAAVERTTHRVAYDGRYMSIDYPNGDVPPSIGVCTDVIIRSYRALGVDLQELVHVDMRDNFARYPTTWGLSRPDPNIDHRRVPNLRTFFERNGKSLPVTDDAGNYEPGDLVTWMLPGNLPHIGIVSDRPSADGERFMLVHNIGEGPRMEDILFDYPITGHYRFPNPED